MAATPDEAAFLRTILDDPADDEARLVYADWLDEQGEAEYAEFLRLTAAHRAATPRMRKLAADLDTDWLAVVSKPAVENCESQFMRSASALFRFVCDRTWDAMTPTENVKVRHCGDCRKLVHFCDTITEAREHAAEGRCVAVDVGIIRRENDLGLVWYTGELDEEAMRREDEARRPDSVSAARQLRKEAGGG